MKAVKNKKAGTFQVGVIELLASIIIFGSAFADNQIIELLWPDGTPDNSIVHNRAEVIQNRTIDQNKFGLNRSISYVSIPSLTVHPAPGDESTGAAIIIFPGGGFNHLTIDKEGHDVARWLNTIGVTGIVVKYRTRPEDSSRQGGGMPENVMNAIISDGRRAVRIVRHRAEKWGIDPNRIGVMGFSAGGYLAASLATKYDQGQNNALDPVERVSCRPAFASLIYSGIPADFESLVSEDTPPMFLVNTGDDKRTPAENSIRLYQALRGAEIQAELHIYTKGGHGFGLGVRGKAVASWIERFAEWLREMNLSSAN